MRRRTPPSFRRSRACASPLRFAHAVDPDVAVHVHVIQLDPVDTRSRAAFSRRRKVKRHRPIPIRKKAEHRPRRHFLERRMPSMLQSYRRFQQALPAVVESRLLLLQQDRPGRAPTGVHREAFALSAAPGAGATAIPTARSRNSRTPAVHQQKNSSGPGPRPQPHVDIAKNRRGYLLVYPHFATQRAARTGCVLPLLIATYHATGPERSNVA